MVIERIIHIVIKRQYSFNKFRYSVSEREYRKEDSYIEKVGILTSSVEVCRIYQIAFKEDILI
jgi:hypothetical protein